MNSIHFKPLLIKTNNLKSFITISLYDLFMTISLYADTFDDLDTCEEKQPLNVDTL